MPSAAFMVTLGLRSLSSAQKSKLSGFTGKRRGIKPNPADYNEEHGLANWNLEGRESISQPAEKKK